MEFTSYMKESMSILELKKISKITMMAMFVSLTACVNLIDKDPAQISQTQVDNSVLDEDYIKAELRADFLESMAALPEKTLLQKDFGLGLSIQEADHINNLIIDTNGKSVDYKVAKIENPDRIVIDLQNIKIKTNKDISANSSIINNIRLGSHANKCRIVLDINNVPNLEERVEIYNKKLVLSLVSKQDEKQAKAAISNEETFQDIKQDSKSDEFAQFGEVVKVKSSENENKSPKVVGLSIDTLGDENLVIVDIDGEKSFKLSRTAPSEYVLSLANTEMDETVNAMLLAPVNSGSIRSIRSNMQDSDLNIRIFVKPDAILKAKGENNKIIVSVEKSLTEVKAQAKFGNEEKRIVPVKEKKKQDIFDDGISNLLDEENRYTGRLISLDLQDTDITNALRIIAEVSNLNIISTGDVTGKVTLRLIDVPWDQALDVILKTNELDQVKEGNVIRVAPMGKLRKEREEIKQAQLADSDLEPLQVMYRRISYAKAAELQPLIQSVLTERGTVSYDDRTNQAIIRDIKKGLRNTNELLSKLDLRTPQVLLETQIVEAQRSLLRSLGSELGFTFIQSPATGNATGHNFPNSVSIGGSALGNSNPGLVSSFPGSDNTAISFLFDSADGSKSMALRLSGLENEGRVKIISRPAVVTTNNKQATIKSVEKIRVKMPSGGLSVATGQGANANGSSTSATETIEMGIVLEVTPQASPDYFVLLDIHAKSSSFGTHTVDGIPSEVERSATSTVLVSSGQTFAMGGIYKITDSDTVEGVPFLKDIPVLGFLFRSLNVDNSDEELLFFITPRIVEGSFDDAAMDMQA